MNTAELTILINRCYNAVEDSKCGKILVVSPAGESTINTVAYNTFLYLIQSLAPKNFSANMDMNMKEEKK